MSARQYHLHNGKKGSALAIRVTPRARRNEVVGVMNDNTVKIRLTAPPVEGKANKALIVFLADLLGVSKSRIEIVAGKTGRDKLVSILDMDGDEVHKIIISNLS